MTRTFRSRMDKKTLLCRLAPATALTVYFFWVKMPVPMLCCMVFLVFMVERLVHTCYVLTDDGFLHVCRGRFSKTERYPLSDIEKADRVRTPALSFLKGGESVVLTFRDGSVRRIAPFPAEEFCKCFCRKRADCLEKIR